MFGVLFSAILLLRPIPNIMFWAIFGGRIFGASLVKTMPFQTPRLDFTAGRCCVCEGLQASLEMINQRGRLSFVLQVASRVQKYFIKLTKAGIPVPGRTPNLCMYTKKVTAATPTGSTQIKKYLFPLRGQYRSGWRSSRHHNHLSPGFTENISGCQCHLAEVFWCVDSA